MEKILKKAEKKIRKAHCLKTKCCNCKFNPHNGKDCFYLEMVRMIRKHYA